MKLQGIVFCICTEFVLIFIIVAAVQKAKRALAFLRTHSMQITWTKKHGSCGAKAITHRVSVH
jgi:hypothetical protein